MKKTWKLPEKDGQKTSEEQGLYKKFFVQRLCKSISEGEKYANRRYFVLDLDYDPFAPAAIRAYALACAETHPKLSSDLLNSL